MKAAMNNKGSTPMCRGFRQKITAGVIAVLTVCAALSANAQGQVIKPLQSEPVLTKDQQHYLNVLIEDESTADYQLVIVNSDAIDERALTIDVFGKRHNAENYDTNRRAPKKYSWFGRTNDPHSSLVFVVNEDMVTGFFTLDYQRYMLYPLGEGLHVLLEKDMSTYPADEVREDYAELEKTAGKPALDKVGYDPGTDASSNGGNRSNNCSIRYLIAYTTAVNSALVDVHSFIQGCVDDHNAVNTLSNGQHHVELARSVRVFYTESGDHAIDRDRFRITNDGFMDEIHALRSLYDADVCQLINNANGGCGIAAAIGASYSTGFAVTKRSCAIGNHTFAHETGHLYGARHDRYVDNSSTPFAYGHGFVNPGSTSATRWRTVMAYNDECDDSGFNCTRLGRWSNPSLTVGGIATGTSAFENNARVVRDEEFTLAGFENEEINKSVFSNDVVFNNAQGHFEGVQTITAPGPGASELEFNFGSVGSIRAGNDVVLAEGFWAKSGTDFIAYNGDCTDAPTLDLAAFDVTADNGNENHTSQDASLPQTNITNEQPSMMRVIPNPFRENAVMLLDLGKDARTSAVLYDMVGKPVLQIMAATQTAAGTYQIQLPIGSLSAGIYILHVQAGDERLTERIVKQN